MNITIKNCKFLFTKGVCDLKLDFTNLLPSSDAKNIKSVSEKTGQTYYEVIYNFFEAKNNDGACELNKATFSTQMVERLLNIYACEDTLVLDPFMGTGTTGVACCKNNIDFIGIEISKKQFEYAKNRMNLNQEE